MLDDLFERRFFRIIHSFFTKHSIPRIEAHDSMENCGYGPTQITAELLEQRLINTFAAYRKRDPSETDFNFIFIEVLREWLETTSEQFNIDMLDIQKLESIMSGLAAAHIEEILSGIDRIKNRELEKTNLFPFKRKK